MIEKLKFSEVKMIRNSFKYMLLAGGITLFASIANAGFQFEGAPSNSMPMGEMAEPAVMPPVTAEPIDAPYIPPATTAEFDEPMDMPVSSGYAKSGYSKGGSFQAGTYMKTKLDDPTEGIEMAALPPVTAGMQVTPDRSLIIKNNNIPQQGSYVATPNIPVMESMSWRARKGESVREVLQRWSTRADINFVWENPNDVMLTQDISYVGNFENAVDELIHKSTDSSLQSQFQDGVVASNNYLAPQSYAPPSSGRDYSTPVFSGYGDSRWDVATGSSLRAILEQWSSQNGTKIIWNSAKDYKFDEPFFIKGTYEQAVERALEQFSDEKGRPLGEIYQDPLTGAPILVVSNG